MRRFSFIFLILVAILVAGQPLFPAGRGPERYALILADPPATEGLPTSHKDRNNAAQDARQRILAAQASLRRELQVRGIPITGAVQSVLNAVFVRVQEDQIEELSQLPGVKGVAPLERRQLKLNKAVSLAAGPAAWQVLGGVDNAGAGVKIAVIDTGIDQDHPAFRDSSLSLPPGFPKCRPEDCAFTNKKVIVARSYVDLLAAGTPPDPAEDSRPDDTSPRDRVGHGTAVAMAAAGGTSPGPLATITGMAPKAWLGNYKVFGSPGVNESTTDDVLIMAIEDALNDGMDIAVLSLGSPAMWRPLDEGPACGLNPGTPCDSLAAALENAVRSGLDAVVSAGNEGNDGLNTPTMNTISSPATAPSVIAAGASTNSHIFTPSVRVPGEGVPENLRTIPALPGDGRALAEPLTAPLRDVSRLGNDGRACTVLPADSLNGAFALIQRGECFFLDKVVNAQRAGAAGVVFYLVDGDESLIVPGGLSGTSIPAMMIGNSNGRALKSFLASHPGADVTMDPAVTQEVEVSPFNTVAGFSSRGPSIDGLSIKPDVIATGTSMYLATQTYDHNGPMYDPSGFKVVQGTSFSAPLVAGAVALAKQRNPGFSPAQLKSAVVNNASQAVTENGAPAAVTSVGGGALNAALSLHTPVTVEPATLSFGEIRQGTLPVSRALEVRNNGAVPVNLAVSGGSDPNALLTLDKSALSLNPGQSDTVIATLSGSRPAPGAYESAITIQGGGASLRIPFVYFVGDGIPANIIPLRGDYFLRLPGSTVRLAVKVIDRFGVPVREAPVQFGNSLSGGSIQSADAKTNALGIATAKAVLGERIGPYAFSAKAENLTFTFGGRARLAPTINPGGVVNAASFEAGSGAAPGSYIAIFGAAMGDAIESAPTANLPLSIGGVSVSFDVPAVGLSLPGRLHVVAPGQVNSQVPWELAGQTSVLIKVSIGDISTDLYELPLVTFSPGVFEYIDKTAKQYFAAALDGSYQVIGSENPARPGQAIALFLNGLGPVDSHPPTGVPTPLEPLSHTLEIPGVTIAGRNARVEFSGLTPSISGLYQVNVVVPPDTPAGVQPVVVSIGGVTAKKVDLPVGQTAN